MPNHNLSRPAQAGFNETLSRNIAALKRRHEQEETAASHQDRLAQMITRFTGSMAFVYLHLAIYGAWIVINTGLVPMLRPFDPSFVILASEASVEAIFLSTFVLISQNRMALAADKRADLDLHINLLAEHEITKLAAVIAAIAVHLGIENEVPPEIDEVKRDVAPEAVLEELASCQSDA